MAEGHILKKGPAGNYNFQEAARQQQHKAKTRNVIKKCGRRKHSKNYPATRKQLKAQKGSVIKKRMWPKANPAVNHKFEEVNKKQQQQQQHKDKTRTVL